MLDHRCLGNRPGRHLRSMANALALVAALAFLPAFAETGPTVTMQPVAFAPAELHVDPGSTVTWTNTSVLEHTVTADDGSFDSGNVKPGETWSMQFDAPGSYQYYCQVHGAPGLQNMAGVIVVDG